MPVLRHPDLILASVKVLSKAEWKVLKNSHLVKLARSLGES